MKRPLLALAAIVLVTALLPAVGAQNVPTPSTNDLGISENDVREEPSTLADKNGFEKGAWSPSTPSLVLDAYVAYGELGLEDISNIQNRVQHGNNYDAHERKMYPGPNYFAAWWGWWTDTGHGGDLRNNTATSSTSLASKGGDGAINDADDCRDDNWDEFVWRGDNGCAERNGHEAYPGDTMFAFIQPGTHNIHVNSIPAPTLGPFIPPSPIHNDTDANQVPDFRYDHAGDGQAWGSPNGFARYEYDQSLLMTTQVLSAVNPKQTGTLGSHTTYDPFTLAADANTHALDKDLYTAASPVVEDLYRTTVWDPEQDYGDSEDEENVLAAIDEDGGAKQFAKEDGSSHLIETRNTAQSIAGPIIETVEPQAGLAYDAFFGPRPHEPNTAGDIYKNDTDGDGTLENLATFDADTSYNPRTDSDGDGTNEYYEPGTAQTYSGYQGKENTWLDTTTAIDVCPLFLVVGSCYHEWAHLGPSVPSPTAPAEDASNKGDQQTVGPGILYVHSNLGTWWDKNGDTWVGDVSNRKIQVPGRHGPGLLATQEGQPYSNGLIQDPNQYGSDEFRPVCKGTVNVTMRSNLDRDNDDLGEWGTTGVYVFPYSASPYQNMYMDAAGDTAEPALSPARKDDNVGGVVSFAAPNDDNGRLSRYRVEGPINMTMITAGTTCQETGSWDPGKRVVFPTGNPGYSFTVTTRAETAEAQVSLAPGNKGTSLKGQSITDVDLIHANQQEVKGTPVFSDHPVPDSAD